MMQLRRTGTPTLFRRQGGSSRQRRFSRQMGCSRQRGFSFAEVMFAVIILGVGFIMVAGIFPVAIQQNQATNEESEAAAAAREAANTISNLPTTVTNLATNASGSIVPTLQMFPPTVKNYTCPTGVVNVVPPPAIVVPFVGPRWEAIKNSLILPSDPRYAYVPLYKRENNASVAQLIVIATAVRNRPTYSLSQDVTLPTASLATVTGVTVARGTYTTNATNAVICPDVISMGSSTAYPGDYVAMNPSTGGVWSGRTYRLGRNIAGSSNYEMDPPDSMVEQTVISTTGASSGNSTSVADEAGTLASSLASPPSNLLWPTNTLQPVMAYARIFSAPGSPGGRIELIEDYADYPGSPASYQVPAAAAQGAFVIVADDYPYDSTTVPPGSAANYVLPPNAPAANPPWLLGSMNGRIFRLGAPVPQTATGVTPAVYAGTFELDPAYGMRQGTGGYASPDTVPNPNIPPIAVGGAAPAPLARVYIVGAGRTNPTSAIADGPATPKDYSGAAQDVSIYTTFVPVQ